MRKGSLAIDSTVSNVGQPERVQDFETGAVRVDGVNRAVAVGWLSQWQEMLTDPEQKIARPRQVWIGHNTREFVPMEKRGKAQAGAQK